MAYVTAPAFPDSPPTVTVIDVATNTITATIALPGAHPAFGIALSPDRAHAYVTLPQDNLISVIDTKTNTATATYALSGTPTGLAVKPPAGQFLYVARVGDGGADGSVAVIDTTTNTLSATVPLDPSCHAADVVLTPNGHFAYVTGYCGSPSSGKTFVVDTATNSLVGSPIAVTSTAFGLTITPNGHFVYVGSQFDSNVSIIATATNTVVATVSNPDGYPMGQQPVIAPDGSAVYVAGTVVSVIGSAINTVTDTYDALGGMTPSTLGITADGRLLYATSSLGPNTIVIDTVTKTLVDTISMEGGNRITIAEVPGPPTPPHTPTGAPTPKATPAPQQCRVTQPGQVRSFAYVAGDIDNTVSVIDTSSMSVVAKIPFDMPQGVAVNPSGTRAYVTGGINASSVGVIDTSTNRVIDRIPVRGHQGIAVDPSGQRIYIVSTLSGSGGHDSVFGLSVADAATNHVVRTIPLGGWPNYPDRLAFSPDGRRIYVSNGQRLSMWVVDLDTNTSAFVPLGDGNSAAAPLAVSADGSRAYSSGGYSFYVIDTGSNTVIQTLPIRADAIAATAGGPLYLGAYDRVLALDPETFAVEAEIPLPYGTAKLVQIDALALNSAQTHLYVPTSGWFGGNAASALSVIDTSTDTLTGTMLIPPSNGFWSTGAYDLAVGPEFTCGNGVVEPCEECDDGNTTSLDGCSDICTIEYVAGGGSRSTDCFTEWVVANPDNRLGQRSAQQSCKDNDPSCDFDGGVVGSCTFHTALCIDVSDPSLRQCAPAALTAFKVMKPTPKDAVHSVAAAGTRTQVVNLMPSMLSAPAGSCSAPMDVTVPVSPGRRVTRQVIRTRVISATGRRDTDTLRFSCLP